MFNSWIRWLGWKAGSGRPERAAYRAPRFVPRLESLEGRALPGGMAGGVILITAGAGLCVAGLQRDHVVFSPHGAPAGAGDGSVLSAAVQAARSIGEEIPQQ